MPDESDLTRLLKEKDLEEELRSLYDEWDRIGIDTREPRRRLGEEGPVETVRWYVHADTPGFDEAARRLGWESTFEGKAIRFKELFEPETVARAEAKRKTWSS